MSLTSVQKKIVTIIFVVKSLRGFGWNNVGQLRRWWPSITSALGQCIVLSGVSSEGCGSTLIQHWLNATCLRKVYNRPGDSLVLGQRPRQFTGIDLAMGCNAGHTLNRNLVGMPTSSVGGTCRQVLNKC